MTHYRYGFVGGGNMATAILGGLLRKGLCQPGEILVSDISEDRLSVLRDQWGVITTQDNARVAREGRAVVLAIKPQTLSDVAVGLAPELPAKTCVVSILAGVRVERLKTALGGHEKVVRTMPNLPATLGRGVAAVALLEGTSEEAYREAEEILGSVGATTRVPESLIDAVTAVSGSGPGYVFRIAEALVAGGVEAGLTAEQARILVSQTLLGAAEMLAVSEESAGELCRKVCSPGGTTLAGLEAMERAGLSKALVAGVIAARDRSLELSKG